MKPTQRAARPPLAKELICTFRPVRSSPEETYSGAIEIVADGLRLSPDRTAVLSPKSAPLQCTKWGQLQAHEFIDARSAPIVGD
jgi:hypothetical protein